MDAGIMNIIGDNENITAVNNEYLITSNSLSNGWKVVCSMPADSVMADLVSVIRALVIIVTLITVLVVLTMLLITSRLNDSVKVVVDDLDVKAKTDLMTGLLNKTSFRNLTESSLEAYDGKQAIAFLMFDLDNFKDVNDMAGHNVGDEVIKRMGNLLKEVFAPEEALIGRIGGDEFAVYNVYKKISLEEAQTRVHDLTLEFYDRFMSEFKPENEQYKLTVSSGVYVTGPGEYKFDDLYQKTDVALYISKKGGKSKPTFI